MKDFEDYMHSVHQEVFKSDVCGLDQWIDNRYAYGIYDGKHHIDTYADHAKSLGYPYHWVQAGPDVQLFVVDPTGFGIQFDGPSLNPPADLPFYSDACKSNDGCTGQGLCNALDARDYFNQFL